MASSEPTSFGLAAGQEAAASGFFSWAAHENGTATISKTTATSCTRNFIRLSCTGRPSGRPFFRLRMRLVKANLHIRTLVQPNCVNKSHQPLVQRQDHRLCPHTFAKESHPAQQVAIGHAAT